MDTRLDEHVLRAIQRAGIAVTDVSIGSDTDRTTWTVTPATLQATAQPIIEGFDPGDPAVARADADREVESADTLADFLDALIANWSAIGTLTAAGKAPQAVAQVKSTWRAKRRARKGV